MDALQRARIPRLAPLRGVDLRHVLPGGAPIRAHRNDGRDGVAVIVPRAPGDLADAAPRLAAGRREEHHLGALVAPVGHRDRHDGGRLTGGPALPVSHRHLQLVGAVGIVGGIPDQEPVVGHVLHQGTPPGIPHSAHRHRGGEAGSRRYLRLPLHGHHARHAAARRAQHDDRRRQGAPHGEHAVAVIAHPVKTVARHHPHAIARTHGEERHLPRIVARVGGPLSEG